jgi:hypothetical protein
VKDAGRTSSFPSHASAPISLLRERTVITLVYQPLKLVTQEVAPPHLTIDDEVFARARP